MGTGGGDAAVSADQQIEAELQVRVGLNDLQGLAREAGDRPALGAQTALQIASQGRRGGFGSLPGLSAALLGRLYFGEGLQAAGQGM